MIRELNHDARQCLFYSENGNEDIDDLVDFKEANDDIVET
jgi:hypothetical protein